MVQVLVVDQFSGIHPRSLQLHPILFSDLITKFKVDPKFIGGYRPAKILEVEESFIPDMCTTVVRSGKDGFAEVWKHRWDSSG